jgi:VCBS repeat-containing protein
MTTLTVSGTHDYSVDPLSGIDVIDFTNGTHGAATATFLNTQFGTQILSDVHFLPSIGSNRVVVNGGSLNASLWTFESGWSAADAITINGSSGDDSIIGSTQDDLISSGAGADTLVGGDGADTMQGGDGNDTFVVSNSSHVDTGEIIDGGTGTADTLLLDTALGFINFVDVVSNIEKLVFSGDGYVEFSGASFGTAAGLINSVTGASNQQRIDVKGAVADLSGVAFVNWTSGNDTVYVHGTAGDDTLTGSSKNDIFLATAGTDLLSGGDGDDRFSLRASTISLGDAIDGGNGTGDLLEMSGIVDLNLLAFFGGMEEFRYDNLSPTLVTMTGAQIVGVTEVDGGSNFSTLVVAGAAVDLSAILFSNWSTNAATISILGSNAANSTLIGSTQRDSISGGALNDSIRAGASNDTIAGAGGIDTIDGGDGAADMVTFTGSWLQYVIGLSAGTHTLVDSVANRDDIDTVTNVETFIFSNGSFAVAAIVNDAPIGVNDTNASDALAVNIDNTASGNVLGNDTDPDSALGDTKTVTGLRTGPESAGGTLGAVGSIVGAFGSLVLNANGTYAYTLHSDDDAVKTIRSGQVVTDVFTYRVNDAKGLTDQAQLTISITGTNTAPIITSSGAGQSAAVNVAENSIAVTTVTATTLGNAATYAITGGADSSRFSISATTGVLAFLAAPDFESPTDAGSDNIYDVIVSASDGANTDDQAIAVTVTNIAGHTIMGSKTNADTINGTKPAGNAATEEEDTINGRGGNDTVKALGGNDTVKGGLGKDILDGGTGLDAVDFSDKTAAVELTLKGNNATTAKVGGVAEDTLKKFESIIGGTAGDKLTGDGKGNVLTGNKGNDTLDGATGNDTLVGGAGKDSLTGGGGNDQFRFNAALSASSNVDRITDFKHDLDLLALDDAIFTTVGLTLDASEFKKGAGFTSAKDADDRIVYNTTTGDLRYDADGKGGAAAILFATLVNKPAALDAGDFGIV